MKPQIIELKREISSRRNCRLVVLEDFARQLPPFFRWLSRHIGDPSGGQLADQFKNRLTTTVLQELLRQNARDFVSDLSSITSTLGISVIAGHCLTTAGRLHDRGGLQGADEVITLTWRENEGVYRLSVERGGRHLASRHWDLKQDENTSRFRLADSSARRVRDAAAREGTPLPFTATESALLEALKAHGPMKHSQIVALRLPNPNPGAAEGSILAGSTISNRLKVLQGESKGHAVLRREDGRYAINPDGQRVS